MKKRCLVCSVNPEICPYECRGNCIKHHRRDCSVKLREVIQKLDKIIEEFK